MSTAASLLLAATLTIWTVLYLLGLREIRRTPVLAPRPGPVPPQITAYVPARDEAEVIEASVRALLLEPAIAQVVVVDDGSTDGTTAILARLAEDPRLRVLAGVGPGPGECGKPAALRQALKEAPPSTPWLLFVDADVLLSAGAAAALLDHAERSQADLLSLYPQLVIGSALEALVMPTVGALVLRRYPPAQVSDPAQARAFANGQVILIRPEVYQRAGGHGAVVHEILEDVRLAERVKAVGGQLRLVDGRALASTRMYQGWAELSEGWGKNLHLLLGNSVLRSLGWLLALPVLATSPLVLALLCGWPWGVGAYLLILFMQGDLRRRAGASPWYAPLAPLGAVLSAVILARSTWMHAGRRAVPWKGRRYRPDESGPKGS